MEETKNEVFFESKTNEEKKTRPYEVIALISFIMCFVSLVLALIFDVAAFYQVILQLIAAIIVPAVLFFIFFILFLASFILIFGFFLVKEYGFWPLTLTIQVFKDIMGEIVFQPNDKTKFITFRIILIVLCALIFISAIISKILKSIDTKKYNLKPNIKSRKLSTAAIVLSTLGIMVSIGAITIFSHI